MHFSITDAAVNVLEEIAQRMYNRKKKFENSHPHTRAIRIAILLFVTLIVVSLLLGDGPVLTFLSPVGIFVLFGMGLLGMALLAMWLVLVFNIHHVNGIESHIEEIRTRIRYDRMLTETTI